jgi:hypothetical protein
MLKNCPAILYDQHRNTVFALRIFCSAGAISGANIGKCGCSDYKQQKKQSSVAVSLCEAHP